MTNPPRPISSSDIPWEEYTIGTRFGGRFRHLTRGAVGEKYRVGVAIEELEPGRTTNQAHYHFFEEEHVFILEGALTARIGDEFHEMKAGDYVCFPAGQKAGHCLINNGDATCRYVMIGENKADEVCVYTDSNKVRVRSLGPGALFDIGAVRDYWHGEDTGTARETPLPVVIRASDPSPPKPPLSSEAVEWNVEGEGPKFGGRSRHLTFAAIGGPDYHVGVLIEQPAPGMRLAPKHYHMMEEEHALILEGEVTLLFGEERIVMKPRDYACFPAGQKIGHSFMNSGNGPCRYLMIGERNPADVCVYPDSNKMSVRALRTENDVFDMSATKRYFDGE